MPRHAPTPGGLAAIAKARRAAGDRWPDAGPVEVDRPATEVDWLGRSRMAHARRAAGLPLGLVDREALDLYPDELDLETHARLVDDLIRNP